MRISKTLMLAACIGSLALAGLLHAGPSDPAAPAAAPEKQAPVLDARALAELELEHSRAQDNLLAAEARLALLAEKLYDSRLTVNYQGTLDTPFKMARVELWIDGTLAYSQEFSKAPTAQSIKLFDGFLIPGRHVLELRLKARGPGDPADGMSGYSAAAGMAVHMRQGAITRAEFEADQDGDAPDAADLRGTEPDGSWDVEIQSAFSTDKK